MIPKRLALAALWALAVTWPGLAAAQSDLERARTLYNAGRFEESIAAANSAKSKPGAAASATLIAARSRLERFRKTADAKDLAAARDELVSLNPRTMAPQEAIEWQIGIGTALFLENQIGPAAEAFTTILPAARARLTHAEYEKLLEWFGTSLSRLAEGLAGDARKHAYEKLRSEVALEFERNPLSRPATYWAVVAARGAGDLDAAWGAAVAGWIRAGGQPEGRHLRGDLDRFVTQTLIPERAQARTGQRLDAKATLAEIAALTDEWRAVTALWSGGA
jgi:tetratricopeptide (TPR) repeat protein